MSCNKFTSKSLWTINRQWPITFLHLVHFTWCTKCTGELKIPWECLFGFYIFTFPEECYRLQVSLQVNYTEPVVLTEEHCLSSVLFCVQSKKLTLTKFMVVAYIWPITVLNIQYFFVSEHDIFVSISWYITHSLSLSCI